MFRSTSRRVSRNRISALFSAIAPNAQRVDRFGSTTRPGGFGVDVLERRVMLSAGYTITPITGENVGYVYPSAINNSGEVVGYITDGQSGAAAFVFQNNTLTVLNSVTQANSGMALEVAKDVNASGVIVGSASEMVGLTVRQTAFSYSNGIVTDLLPLSVSSSTSIATGINASGLIVGTLDRENAGIFANGTATGVGDPGDELLSAAGVNDNGDIVGTQNGFDADTGFLRSGGVTTTIPGPATAINNSKQVVGSTEVNSYPQGYLYSNGTSTPLFRGTPAAINDAGVVVGCDGTTASQYTNAYIYSNGVSTDLNTLIAANSGWVLEGATGINSSGQITGSGELNGQPEGFILTPGNISVTGSATSLTLLGASPSSIALGTSITFDAVVNGATTAPSGTVTFLDNGTPFGNPQTLNDGGSAEITTTSLTAGAHNITASYSGDTVYAASASLPNVVNVGSSSVTNATTSTLASSANVFEVTQSCELTCTILPQDGSTIAPTGTITIFEDGVNKNTETLDANGSVVVMWTANTAGPNTLVDFVYNGDSNYAASTSNTLTQTYLPLSQLAVNINNAVIPPAAISGQPYKAKIPASFKNEAASLAGTYTVVLYADTSSNGLTGNQVALQTVKKHESLKANKTFSVTLSTKTLPTSLPAGTYYLLTKVTDPSGNSNLVNTSQTVAVTAPVVTLAATVSAVKPTTITSKKAGSLAITLQDTGNVNAVGTIVITIVPSSDGVTPVEGFTFVTTPPKRTTVKLNKPGKYTVHFKVPPGLAAGSYSTLATISLDGATTTATGSPVIVG